MRTDGRTADGAAVFHLLSLLRLLHITDSSFPSGVFAHSWGLEYAIVQGWVHDVASLEAWLADCVAHYLIPLEGLAAQKAYVLAAAGEYERLVQLDRDLSSYRINLASREAAAQMGRSFLTTVNAMWRHDLLLRLAAYGATSSTALQHAVAWGAATAMLEIPPLEMLESFLIGTLRQFCTVAMRLIPLGQTDANLVLARLLEKLDGQNLVESSPLSIDLASNLPGMDIAVLGHENLKARYFRS